MEDKKRDLIFILGIVVLTFAMSLLILTDVSATTIHPFPITEDNIAIVEFEANPAVVEINGTVGETKEWFIAMRNSNAIPVDVTLQSPEGVDVNFRGDEKFTLQPNEYREVDYEFKIKQNGTYSDVINIIVDGGDSQIGMQQELHFNDIQDKSTTAPTKPNQNIWLIIFVVAVVIIVGVVIYLIVRSRRNKEHVILKSGGAIRTERR